MGGRRRENGGGPTPRRPREDLGVKRTDAEKERVMVGGGRGRTKDKVDVWWREGVEERGADADLRIYVVATVAQHAPQGTVQANACSSSYRL
jgi:hypothetical protein